MEKHFRWHFADLFALELRIPNYPVTPAKIDATTCARQSIHWQTKAVTLDTFFVSQSLRKQFA